MKRWLLMLCLAAVAAGLVFTSGCANVGPGPYVTTGGGTYKTVGKQLLDLYEDYAEGDMTKAKYLDRRKVIIDEALRGRVYR